MGRRLWGDRVGEGDCVIPPDEFYENMPSVEDDDTVDSVDHNDVVHLHEVDHGEDIAVAKYMNDQRHNEMRVRSSFYTYVSIIYILSFLCMKYLSRYYYHYYFFLS